ncbi:MAG TPA: hypothetical protein VIE63_17335 [Ramlibacter sp.]
MVESAPPRRDDDKILTLIGQIPQCSPGGPVFTAGLLNEVGLLYREVELRGEFEALQFTARMNASGFVQLRSGAVSGHTSVFCKP